MKRTPVKSSNISEVGFDPDTSTLAVLYKNGTLYHYAGVDADKHAALLKAPSIGGFVHANVKGVHKHTKVDSGT